VHFHFTPTYSSWLNQVELWFAKIEREVIARGIFTSVPDLVRKLRRYINAYSANARPIQWKYSDPSRRLRTNEFTVTGHQYPRTMEEFRLDWAALMAKSGTSPTAENIALLIDRAKKFRIEVDGLVPQETKDWVTEFQNSRVQMEKDVAAQVASLKAQIDKGTQAKVAPEKPGSIQLEIQNASKADSGSAVSVCLTDAGGKTTQRALPVRHGQKSVFCPDNTRSGLRQL
jgi:hypothetical protein